MSDRSWFRIKWQEVAIVLAFIAMWSCCLLPAVWNAERGLGRAIPEEPPEEYRRVYHPAGFSIVAPRNWEACVRSDLGLYPMSTRAGRSKAWIKVQHVGWSPPPDLKAMRVVKFLGQEAYETMSVVREDSFDDPAWSEYRMYFQHEGRWYEIEYGVAEERTELPPIVRSYLNTLRWFEANPDWPLARTQPPKDSHGEIGTRRP
jgi:hypothetical protein